jgi:hypothetical protein
MLSNLLYSGLSNAIENLVRLEMSNEALLTSLLFSAGGAILLAKFTGTIGHLTYPLNFSALFIGAGFTNILLAGVDIPTIQYQQEVLLFTILGLITGSFAMLWCVRPERS